MDALVEYSGDILAGFWTTIQLFLWSAVGSLVFGTMLAAMRVGPVPIARAFAAGYVHITRNAPSILLFVIVVFGFPVLKIQFSFFTYAVIALTIYKAGFICEALRSGIQAIQPGQTEAARSIGMTGWQVLRYVILPQGFRSSIQPINNTMIALLKSTAIAAGFGVAEATYQLDELVRDRPDVLYIIFFGIAAGYIALTLAISGAAQLIEKRLEVVR
jgi:glutamate transport system permease protein